MDLTPSFHIKDNISEINFSLKNDIHPLMMVSQTFGLFHSHLRSVGVVHRVHGSVTLVVLMMPL